MMSHALLSRGQPGSRRQPCRGDRLLRAGAAGPGIVGERDSPRIGESSRRSRRVRCGRRGSHLGGSGLELRGRVARGPSGRSRTTPSMAGGGRIAIGCAGSVSAKVGQVTTKTSTSSHAAGPTSWAASRGDESPQVGASRDPSTTSPQESLGRALTQIHIPCVHRGGRGTAVTVMVAPFLCADRRIGARRSDRMET